MKLVVLFVAPATLAFGLPAGIAGATKVSPTHAHSRPVQPPPPPFHKQGEPPHAVMLATMSRASSRANVGGAAQVTHTNATQGASRGHGLASKASPQDVAIYPGAVSTFAGSGTNATVDGTGTAASFQAMGGTVVTGGAAYIATVGAIRKVDLTTTAVTTLAGSATLTACTDSTDPTQVRFSSSMGDIVTDGTYLYVTDMGCLETRKVTIATGATSMLTSGPVYGSVTLGSDGYLYVAAHAAVYKVDPVNGTSTVYYQFDSYHSGLAIASDSQYLWASTYFSTGGAPCTTHLLRITYGTPTVTTYSIPGGCTLITGHSQLVSTGTYLYASSGTDTGLERFTEADATIVQVAGTNAGGYVDGTGTDAWFSLVTGVASDGTSLWVDDSGNYRFRKIVAGSFLPKAQSSIATTNTVVYPGKVTTFAGNGTNATVDGTGTAASFQAMGGAVVVGGAAYVATVGAIRKVDLTTAGVTTFAGSATLTGCTDSTDHNQARFGSPMGDITTDGYYLYVTDLGCLSTRRVSLATGATSTISSAPVYGSVTFGSDGYLYVAAHAAVYKVDPVNGTSAVYYTFDFYHSGLAIASDSQYLWVSTYFNTGGPNGTHLLRITYGTPTVTTFTVPGGCTLITGYSQLASAGNYLYVSNGTCNTGSDYGVERITKATGAVGSLIGGGISGMVDDTWANARFAKVTGVASDGTNLWVDDSGNYRFREVQFVPLLAQEIGPASSSDATTPRAMSGDPVDTSSGSFTWSVTDASVPGIGLPFTYTRWYSSLLPRQGARLGIGWTDSFDATLEPGDGAGDVGVSMPDGQLLWFKKNGSIYTHSPGIWDTLTKAGSIYTLRQPDGTTYTFDLNGVLQSIADRNSPTPNHTLTLLYAGGQLTSVTDTAGRTVSFTYTSGTTTMTLQGARSVTYHISNGLLTSVDDLGTSSPGTTTYTYTGQTLQKITDQNNQFVVFNTYQPITGQIATQEDTNGTSSYLFAGLTTMVTDNRGKLWTYQYLLPGELGSVTDPNNNTTSYSSYDLNHLTAQVITRPGNLAWQYNYTFDPIDGHVTQLTIIPPSPFTSNNVTYTYNSYQEVTSYQDGLNHITRYEYNNANGNVTCVLLPTASVTTCSAAAQPYKYTYAYYSNKLVKSVTDPNSSTTTYNYDSDGDVCWVMVGTSSNACSSPPSGSTSYGYDLNTGWRTSMVTPRGNTLPNVPANFTWLYSYWPDSQLHTATDPLSHLTTYSYHLTGTLYTVTDANTHGTTYDYYGGGQLEDVQDALGRRVSYTYDPGGNLQTVTDQNFNVTTYGYWENNQLKSITDQLTRAWQYSLYNPTAGQITETLPSTDTVTRAYDQMDRLASITYSNAPTTPNVSFTYDKAGNRFTMVSGNPPVTTNYGYDQMNRLTSAGSFSYTYDAAGNLTRRTYPEGTKTSYNYDDHNHMCYAFVGASTAACGSPPSGSTIYAYNLAGGTITKTLPNSFASTATYDNADRLTNLTNIRNSQTMSSFAYTLDNVGNPTVLSTLVNGQSETIHYTYQSDDRLQQACYDAAGSCSGTGLAGISYGYDSSGNITSKQTFGSTPATTTYAYNTDNQLCWSATTAGSGCSTPPNGATLYSYSVNGNQTAAGTSASTYDLANRRISTSNVGVTDTYTYDGDGNRLTDTTGQSTNNYTWDMNASVPLLATETPGGSTRRYIYGSDGPLSLKTASNFYYLTDGLGSVANVTDSSGVSRWDYTYEPYGACRTCVSHGSNPPLNPMRFDGQYQDTATTGSYDLRARMYDPGTGSLLQPDPVGSSPSYAFASGRPTVMTDPSGMFSLRGILDWFNEHLNPGYAYLQSCFGSDGSGSLGSWAARCAFGSAGLAVTAVALAGPVARLTTSLVGRFGATEAAGAAINTGDVAVYTSTNAAGEVDYIGITNNVERRTVEQLATKGIDINPIEGLENLSRADARAVEQVLIEENGGPGGGQLLNRINSIATSNPLYAQSIQRGCDVLATVGFGAPNVCG